MKQLAIVGLGFWGQNLVASVQGSSELLRFAAGVARRPEALQDFATRRGLRLLTDYEQALEAADIDGIVLTTPDRQHPAQVVAAARARKPVLVEKPFALDRASADLAMAAAAEHTTLVAFAHNRRFLPAVHDMADRLAAGRIGRILHVEGNFSSNYGLRFKPGMWRASPDETVAGGMTGMGIHHLDLMIQFAGPIGRLQAQARRQVLEVPVADNVTVQMEFASGATGSFTTLITTSPLWRLRLLGTQGWIEMIGENRLLTCEGHGPVQETLHPVVSTERLELEAFVRAIDGAAYPVPAGEALHGVSALEAVVTSIHTGAAVDVPR